MLILCLTGEFILLPYLGDDSFICVEPLSSFRFCMYDSSVAVRRYVSDDRSYTDETLEWVVPFHMIKKISTY